MKIILMLLLLLLLIPSFHTGLYAQGEATVLFLMINPGAREGGMGEAGVALANDANAIYWNPAGLAFQYNDPEVDKKGEATLMHVNWLPQFNLGDMYYEYAAGRYFLQDIGMVGLAIQYINYGESIWTGEDYGETGRNRNRRRPSNSSHVHLRPAIKRHRISFAIRSIRQHAKTKISAPAPASKSGRRNARQRNRPARWGTHTHGPQVARHEPETPGGAAEPHLPAGPEI